MGGRGYDLVVGLLHVGRLGLSLSVLVVSLTAATVVVGLLQDSLGVPNPSAVYLLAVVATAFVAGMTGAILASLLSAVGYNLLFTEPRYTLNINDPGEWLSVLLLLLVGIVVGQLAAIQRSRAEEAGAREREARALFKVSRALATRQSTTAVLPDVTQILLSETDMARIWISLGVDDATERVVADSGVDGKPRPAGLVNVLRRMPGDEPAKWLRVHQTPSRGRLRSGSDSYRVRVEASGTAVGSIWGARPRGIGRPDRTETRLLGTAADQLGQAAAHDRLVSESQAAEIARQSDALKSALLQSVSHDLRTPLATIRAAAGTLRRADGLTPQDRQDSADAIEREVEYLDRLVTNLLDLSRIEAGALEAEREVCDLADLLAGTLDRLRSRLAARTLELELDVPPVNADPTFLDQAVTNLIENALKYTPAGTALRISAAELNNGRIRLTVEDAGPGVPAEALPRLFEKFYRAPGRPPGSRAGTGIGLAVVRGLADAMDGQVQARPSQLGGLAIDLDLPAAQTATEPVRQGAA